MAAATFGVYVHIPFCASKCEYCAFATWTDRDHLVEAYLAALRTEISLAVDAGLAVADTVFVGGGTPTLVSAEGLADVVSSIPVSADAEVTVECNPDDVTVELLQTYRGAGVNRVSLGVQSMSAHVLASLGRTHDEANVERAVRAIVESGMPSFNLDLIYGAAGESVDDWHSTVAAALAFDPPHISAYGLTVEAGTPLASQPDRHPDDDDQADKYELVDDLLTVGRIGQLRGVELGQARSRITSQLPLLGPGRLPRLRLCCALTRVGSPVVERAHTRSVHRGDRPWRDRRSGVGDARCRDAPRRRPATRASYP